MSASPHARLQKPDLQLSFAGPVHWPDQASLTTTLTCIFGGLEMVPLKLPETGGASAGCRVTATAM
jgi:hypothetical protein